MADIDFDELDKAVNRLMDQRKTAAASDTATPADPSEHSQTPDVRPRQEDMVASRGVDRSSPRPVQESSSSSEQPDRDQSSPSRPSSSVPSPAIKRQKGRFMDIVHPSQSMAPKNAASRRAPSASVSRNGSTVNPSRHIDESSQTSEEQSPTPPTTADSIAERIAATLAQHDDHRMHTEPHDSTQASQPVSDSDDAATDQADHVVAAKPGSKEDVLPREAPLESPFLSGATVEKRPLGGAAPVPDPIEEITQTQFDDAITPEMDEAVLAVEAREIREPSHVDTSESEADESAAHRDATSSPKPSAQEDTRETPTDDELLLPATASPDRTPDETSDAHTDARAPASPSVRGDIPKQYAVTPSDEDEPSSIYDPAHYQDSIEHPAKKKSSWWVVFWILLLLVGGAAAGAAAYFYLLG